MNATLPSDASAAVRNVLLVEDDDDIRYLMRFWLEDDDRCGRVAEAVSPAEAVAAAATDEFEVIVLDYMLTAGTALDCVRELRRLQPAALIIVYTANRAVAEQAGIRNLGADVVVEKMTVVVEDVVRLVLGDEASLG